MRGKHLCPLAAYCKGGKGGKPLRGVVNDDGNRPADAWAPYRDDQEQNTWVNLGTKYEGRLCHTHIDCCKWPPAWGKDDGGGQVIGRLLCCGGSVDAAPANADGGSSEVAKPLAMFTNFFRKADAKMSARFASYKTEQPMQLLLEDEGLVLTGDEKELVALIWESVTQVQAVKASTDPEMMEIVVFDTDTQELGANKLAIEVDSAIKVRAAVSAAFGVPDENPGKFDIDCTTGKAGNAHSKDAEWACTD